MLQGGYRIRDQSAIHFITFAVTEWMNVFTRNQYADIVLESLRYYQKEKDLLLHAWCIMSNHLNLIVSSSMNDLSGTLRDFKKFTSKKLIKAIEGNKQESRRDWMLSLFRAAGEKIAGIKNTKSGSRTIIQSNCTAPPLLYSVSIVYIRIR